MDWQDAVTVREEVQAAVYQTVEDALADFLNQASPKVGTLWSSFIASKKRQVSNLKPSSDYIILL